MSDHNAGEKAWMEHSGLDERPHGGYAGGNAENYFQEFKAGWQACHSHHNIERIEAENKKLADDFNYAWEKYKSIKAVNEKLVEALKDSLELPCLACEIFHGNIGAQKDSRLESLRIIEAAESALAEAAKVKGDL